jgi:CspA family cold shock protein
MEANMQIGTVKWFNSAKGYGFITPDNGGDDCFVHVTAIQDSGLKQLIEDQRVEYDMQEGRNGRMVACGIVVLMASNEAAAE